MKKLARRAALALLLAALPACGTEEREAQRAATERAARDEVVTEAARAASAPATGLWSEEHLLDRLVRAGVAPRRSAETRVLAADWMNQEPVVLLAGGGELYAWIYPDSTARRAATEGLDPATGTPPGQTVPFAPPMRFIVQNNMAAVISGGTETNHERIALALQAGLPAAQPRESP